MDSDAEMMQRHAALLARFAGQAASLAEDLHACALSAETRQEKEGYALSFQRMGRALRQTLALEAKLRKDAAREARGAEEHQAARKAEAVSSRRNAVKAEVTRLIWTEAERDTEARDHLELDLEERLFLEAAAETFLDQPIETVIERLAQDLGLTLPSQQSRQSSWPGSSRPPMIAGEADHDPAPPPGSDRQNRCSWGTSPAMTDSGLGDISPKGAASESASEPFIPRWDGDGPWNST